MRAALTAELSAAQSPEIENGQLRVHPATSMADVRRWTAWPGFHANTANTDLLH